MTPLPGVSFNKAQGKWKVRLRCQGLSLYGGCYGDLDKANDVALRLYRLFDVLREGQA